MSLLSDNTLRLFYANDRKKNGEKYTRDFSYAIWFGLQQFLMAERDINITEDLVLYL